MLNIMWFRNDLRIHDNTALLAALRETETPLIAIYCLCKSQFAHYQIGNQKHLVAKALTNLEQSLSNLAIPLIVLNTETFANTPKSIIKLCQDLDANALYFNIENGFDERSRDKEIAEGLQSTICHRFHDDSLVAPWNIKNKQGAAYKVFTPFSKACKQELEMYPTLAVTANKSHQINENASHLADVKTLINTSIQTVDTDELSKQLNVQCPDDLLITEISENDGQSQLQAFIQDRLATYKQDRDRPDLNKTSQLSTFLALGILSPRLCYQKAMEQPNSDGKATWINELLWRDFYRYIMWQFPHVSKDQAFLTVDKQIQWNNVAEHYQAFVSGQTGIPMVDAGIRQLKKTGWMHNRVRMIVASFFTKNLWMDWRKGGEFFAKHLIDYDFASNVGGWQWAASIGTDAAPYFRVFNPVEQGKRFDPNTEYIKQYVPELRPYTAKQIHDHVATPLRGYAKPIVDLKQTRAISIEKFKQAKAFEQTLQQA